MSVKLKLAASVADIDALHACIKARGKTAQAPKEALERVLTAHTQLVNKLIAEGVEIE